MTRSASASQRSWGPWALAAVIAGVALASLSGKLNAWSQSLTFGSPLAAAGLAAFSLLPLGFYALSLERDKAAPAFRGPWAPWVAFIFLHVGIQLSGGLVSPLWPAYAYFTLLLARHAGWGQALTGALAISVLEGFPLWQLTQESGNSYWPQAVILALPWLGLPLGLGRERPRATAKAPDEAVAASPAMPVQSVTGRAAALSLEPSAQAGDLDPLGLLDRDHQASLDLLFDSHPALNALSLWWGDADSVELRHLRLRQGQPKLQAQVLPGEGLLGHVLREQRPLTLDPVAPSAAMALPYIEGAYAVQALHALPLSDEGRFVGLLAADKAQAVFTAEELSALSALARLVVQHSQRAALLQNLQKKGGRTERLYEVNQALSRKLDYDSILDSFGQYLQSLVPCDSWALGLREDEGGALHRRASLGYAADAPQTLSVDRSSALAATLAESEGALLFNREQGSIAPAVLQEGLAREARCFLLAPLRVGGRATGVIKLDRVSAPFSQDERDVAYIFASHAAVALEHARLYSMHQRLATTDGLTGLYNHRFFQERLAIEIENAARTGRPLSLGLTDIDFFKKFNDTFGHQEGDVVLKKVAKLLQEQVRPGKDVVCRYGGEEFVVIMPDCDLVEARQVLDQMRAYCADNMMGGSGPEARAITMSIGLSTYPQAAKEQRDLIHAADEALYKAKHGGRNRVCSFKD